MRDGLREGERPTVLRPIVLIFSVLLFCLPHTAFAQTWARAYNYSINDAAYSVEQTSDGGFVVAGGTHLGGGNYDFWVMKLDASGNVVWQKIYGGGDSESARSIQQTSDGGYVVAGGTVSFGAGGSDFWVMKLDASGNISWQKIYGGASDDIATSIQQTSDGGFIVAGRTDSFGAGLYDFWVIKLDASGNVSWQKTYGGGSWDYAYSIQQTTDGGFVAAGYTYSFGAGDRDVWVLKLDTSGNVSWQKTYSGTGSEWAYSIQQTTDGGFVVAGWTDSFGAGFADSWVLKLDGLGTVQWQKTYGGAGPDQVYSIQQTTDGGFVAAGWTQSFGAGSYDFWVLKLNASGNVTWQKAYGGVDWDEIYSIQQTTDGGFVAAGRTDSFGAGNSDFWVLRLDASGNIDASCTFIADTAVTGVNSTASVLNTSISGVSSAATITNTAISGENAATFDEEQCYGCTADAFEPDNSCIPSKTVIHDGETQTHNFCYDTEDFLSFNACAGRSYTIETSNLGPSADTVLELYGTDCATLLDSDDNGGSGNASLINWIAPSAGTYHVKVLQFDATTGKDRGYDITLAGDTSPCITWARTYGGSLEDQVRLIQQTADGGYVVAGDTQSFVASSSNIWVLKLDASGNVTWQKTYVGGLWDFSNSIQQTSDGGYVVAGRTDSFGAGFQDFWVLKLNASGNVTWQKTYGGGSNDWAESIQQTTDGGFVVTGFTGSFGAGSADLWLLKLDASGNVSWQKTYGGGIGDAANSIQQTTDGGYIVAGTTNSFGAGDYDFWVLKLDASGNVQWQKTYGGASEDRACSIQQTSDGGYVVAGYTQSFSAGNYDFWVLKLDGSGNVAWQKMYGGADWDTAYSIEQTTDGGFAVAGRTESFGAGYEDAWVLKMDANGNIDPSCTFISDTAATITDTTAAITFTTVSGVISAASISDTTATVTDTTATVLEQCNDCPALSVSAVADSATVCLGTMQTYTATPTGGKAPLTFEWDFSYDGVTFNVEGTGNPVSYAQLSAGSYTVRVRVTDSCGLGAQTAEADVPVTVNANPVPVITPSGPTTFCDGGSVTLDAGAWSGYSWSTGAKTQTINVTASGSYTVTVTDGNGCPGTSAPETVTVNANPTASIDSATPNPTTQCRGVDFVGSVVNGTGPYTYEWDFDSDSVVDASGVSLTSPSYMYSAAGSPYTATLTVTDSVGCASTTTFVGIVVNPNPVATIVSATPNPTTECRAVDFVGSVVNGTGPYTYEWDFDSDAMVDASGMLLTSPSYTYWAVGSPYTATLTVTDYVGCVSTTTFGGIVVNPNPIPVITPDGPTTFCDGGSVTLDAGGGYTSYLWAPGGETTQTILVTASDSYSVEVVDGNGCSGTSAPETVTANENPSASPTIDVNPVCLGMPSSFSADANGGSPDVVPSFFDDMESGSNGWTVNPDPATDPINLWHQVTDPTCAPASHSASTSWYFGIDGACNFELTDSVDICPDPGCTGPGNRCDPARLLCRRRVIGSLESPVIAVSGGTALSFWSRAETESGAKYDQKLVEARQVAPVPGAWQTVGQVTDVSNTWVSYSYNITPYITGATSIQVRFRFDSVDYVRNQGLGWMVDDVAVGDVIYTYLWDFGNGDTSALANPTYTYPAAGSYTVTVTVTDANLCTSGLSGVTGNPVVVNPNPTPVITPDGPTTFCDGGSVTLDAGAWSSYSWSTGATTQTILVTASDSYSVDVVDANGCSGTSAPETVTVNALPTPVITPSGPTTFCDGGSVTLDAGTWSSYSWSTSETTQTILVTTSGSYTVTVTDANGCSGTSAAEVVTVDCPTWARTYGGADDDFVYSIQQIADGGYVVAGWTSSFGADSGDFWVLKLDVSGNIQWQKIYGGASFDSAYSVQQTTDGGYVIAGRTQSFGAGDFDFWVLKLDASGNVTWQKTYGGIDYDDVKSIRQTTDGGYVMAGRTLSFGANGWDFWVLKLDASGNVTWQKTYGGANNDEAYSIQQTTDGGYVVLGHTFSFGAGGYDFWVLKLDAIGNIQWQKTYGGAFLDNANAVQQTTDGGYVVAGLTFSFGAGNRDFWILKLDASGNVQWQKTYGGVDWDVPNSIQQTTDGGFVVAGYTQSFGAGSYDFWVLKLNASGSVSWQKTYGGAILDEVFSIQQTTDGGFVVAGRTESFGAGYYDFWVLKMDANGNIDPSCTFIANTAVTGVNSSATVADTGVSGVDSSATVTDTAVADVDSLAVRGCPCELLADILPNFPVICAGVSVTLDANPSIGTPPYAFLWNTGATSQTITVSPVVTTVYSVTVTVANGCSASSSETVIVPEAAAVAYDTAFDPVATLAEDCGDGDAMVEPGERWSATVRLINNAASCTAHDVKADLTVNAASLVAATACNNPGTYGDIPASGTATFTYSFLVDTGAVCVNNLTFDVTGIVSDELAYPSEVPAFGVQVGRSQTGTQAIDPLTATNETISSDFAPPFSIAAPAAAASLSYTLTGTTDLVNCVEVALVDPFATAMVVKPLGAADANPYDVTGLYTGAGTYQLRLFEDSKGCGGGGDVQIASGTLSVIECHISACACPLPPPSEPSPVGSPDPLLIPTTAADQVIVEDVENETGYVVYENAIGTWYGTPSRGCLAAWTDLGAAVQLNYPIAPGDRWVVVSAANLVGESSCGMDSAGVERNTQPGWPATGPCP